MNFILLADNQLFKDEKIELFHFLENLLQDVKNKIIVLTNIDYPIDFKKILKFENKQSQISFIPTRLQSFEAIQFYIEEYDIDIIINNNESHDVNANLFLATSHLLIPRYFYSTISTVNKTNFKKEHSSILKKNSYKFLYEKIFYYDEKQNIYINLKQNKTNIEDLTQIFEKPFTKKIIGIRYLYYALFKKAIRKYIFINPIRTFFAINSK